MSVGDRIKAVFILQKFVRMSRFLLPSYLDLIDKKVLSRKEKVRRDKIKIVYDTFRASSETSVMLINSNILELIKGLYALTKVDCDIKSTEIYKDFITESDGLIKKWNKIILN